MRIKMIFWIVAWMIFLGTTHTVHGQNYVSGGAFEANIGCPSDTGQFPIIEPVGYYGHPSLLHTCAAGGSAGIPANKLGFEYEPSGGDGYIAVQIYGNNERDFICGQFGTPIVFPHIGTDTVLIATVMASICDLSTVKTTALEIRMKATPFVASDFVLGSLPIQSPLGLVGVDTSGWERVLNYEYFDSGDTFRYWAVGNFRLDQTISVTEIYDPTADPACWVYLNNLCVQFADLGAGIENYFCYDFATPLSTTHPARPSVAQTVRPYPNPVQSGGSGHMTLQGVGPTECWRLIGQDGKPAGSGIGPNVEKHQLPESAGTYWLTVEGLSGGKVIVVQ